MSNQANNQIKYKFKYGVLWSILGQFGSLGITFITNIFLARLLGPKEFGIIAIAMFFIALANVLTESGLGGALIRKTDATRIDNSTIFIFNLTMSSLLYLILFFSSYRIENYYEIENLSIFLRYLGIVLIINSFKIIQNVQLIKELRYKEISTISITSSLLSSAVAITMAFRGYGVWSLIILQILNSFISSILYWIQAKSTLSFSFSLKSFKELYAFGLFTTLSSLLNTGFNNIYQMILGKNFNLNQTGYYYQSQKLTDIPMGVINSLTQGVVFSTLSNLQNDRESFDPMYNNVIRVFTSTVGLISLGIFLYSKEILYIFYGEKWLGASFYMQILAISGFFYIQEMFNRVLFKVYNKSSKIFYLELIKKGILLITIFAGVYFKSIKVLMFGYLTVSIISYFINYYVSRKVYSPSNKVSEFKYTLIVIVTMIVTSIIYIVIKELLQFSLLMNLILSPLVVFIYLWILQEGKVINIKDDIKTLKMIK